MARWASTKMSIILSGAILVQAYSDKNFVHLFYILTILHDDLNAVSM